MISKSHERTSVVSSVRIAFATVQFAEVGSGPGTFTRYLWQASDIPHEVVFFTEDAGVHAVANRLIPVRPVVCVWPLTLLIRSSAYHRAIRRHERRQAFDLIWFNTYPPLALASTLLGHSSPIVLMISDYSNAVSRWPWTSRRAFGLRRAASRSVLRLIERFVLQRAAAVVANSDYTRDIMIAEYRLDPDKVIVLPKGVDLSAFKAPSTRPGLMRPIQILFLKTDYMLGGLPELFEALSSFEYPFELTVAGPRIRDTQRIRQLARSKGFNDEFRFLARVSRNEVPDLMRSHDVLCVPSRAEALGVVFLEALAAGMAVIGTKVGGIPDVLDQGRAGWMVEPFDSEGLRETLVSLIENDVERQLRIEAGRIHVQKYSVGNMKANFSRLAEQLYHRNEISRRVVSRYS